MAIEITIEEILDKQAVLGKLGSLADVTVKTKYWASKLLRKLVAELKDYEETRRELIKKLGAPKEDKPEEFEVKPENLEKFREEIKVLLSEKVIVEGVTGPIPLLEGDCGGLSAMDIAALEPIFSMSEPVEKVVPIRK